MAPTVSISAPASWCRRRLPRTGRRARRPAHVLRLGQRRRVPEQRRDLAAQQHHPGEPRLRRHLGRRRDPGLVPRLAAQPERRQPQLDLHDAVQPQGGQLLLLGAGDRRHRPDDVLDQPGPAHDQRPGARRRAAGRQAERDRHGHGCHDPPHRPRRHGDRRQGRSRRSWSRSTTTTPTATSSPTARWRRPSRRARPSWPSRTRPRPPGPCRSTCPDGDWNVTAYGYDTVDQQDTSTSGATARYRIYPGDTPPTLTENLLAPTEGTTFADGRIFVSGRVEDDQAMQRVEVAIMDARPVHELVRHVHEHARRAGARRS